MKRIAGIILILICFFCTSNCVIQAENLPQPQTIKPSPNARKIDIAFVLDGESDKNAEILKTFQKTISKSLLPDFIASYPSDLIFTGNWTAERAKELSEKALASRATTVVSLGYLSSDYLADKKNKNKFVVTIDEYGLRDLGSNAFFNPIKQYANDFILFQKLIKTNQKMDKTAILMNENFYKTRKNWDSLLNSKFKEKNLDLKFEVIPISSKDLVGSLNKISKDTDAVFVTPLFNLTLDQRKEVFNYINYKKLPSFSSLGSEDVEIGAMLGTSTPDADRKLAEATSFNIHGYLHGNVVKNEKIPFYDDKIIFYNKDIGELIGFNAPLRLLNNCEIISHKEIAKYDLSYVLDELEKSNLDIKQKKFLVDAARRSTVAAYLKYLPTLRIDLGHQSYNKGYASSYSDVPVRVGQFTIGMDQMLYAPDLVTNILVKHKKLKFDKAEKVLTEQNLSLEVANLYLDTLMLENAVKVQEEHLQESHENLAIARTRENKGFCGREETMRWAGKVAEEEKDLLNMRAELSNIKIQINKLLDKNQKEDFSFKPLTAGDPAFFTSDIHILDHIRTPQKLDEFTDMIIAEATYLSPETTKLKAAIAMKKAEIANYAQKFVLPNAMLTLEHTTQFDRSLPYEKEGHLSMASAYASSGGLLGTPYLGLDTNSTRLMIAAQWKPIEGGQKIAEIARCKSELNQLNTYLDEANKQIELDVREVINKAIAKYFVIEKSYKSMFAQAENYQIVKDNYLMGKAPISQLVDAQELYNKQKIDAMNSQYEFFKELIWVQRALVSVNWTKASDRAKKFITQKVPSKLTAEPDFSL